MARTPRTAEQVATAIAARTRREGECLIWQGPMTENGYGLLYWRGERRAHRVAYIIANGDVPDGQVIRHKCDTPLCVEPSHLVAGSQADNMRDARERGGFVMTGGTSDRSPSSRALYPSQRALLQFIHSWQAADGLPPSLRQIEAHMNFGKGSAFHRLNALERRGLIVRDGRLRITPKGYAEVAAQEVAA